ncbi:ABC transporter ATP-binding protein [Deinococcus aquiradiocola]|uniref:Macrolide ABC transporter ATP-binding protein n=1 Tax=Deinococcus aquiradiocola TaxID=393059 RepID=A0A917PPC1_9DEIO|nr:ABC transporter ATP-binding protein [Deinococcus aquiradiocola]GGJ87038.1 macrolide ABC transporter ATP-binding protein [Deinococcus aquiradiocola]
MSTLTAPERPPAGVRSPLPIISMTGVGKTYGQEGRTGAPLVRVLRDVDLEVRPGEYAAVIGPSGSGKSTLMHLIGLLDRPSQGEYLFGQQRVQEMSTEHLSRQRNRSIGFVFQTFFLLPKLTVLQNVVLPLRLRGASRPESEALARQYLERLGMLRWSSSRPPQLSGGQKQRVVIARALAQQPAVILADEPTGNLDSGATLDIMQVFDDLHALGTTIITVTHDLAVARRAQRVIQVADGTVISGGTD